MWVHFSKLAKNAKPCIIIWMQN